MRGEQSAGLNKLTLRMREGTNIAFTSCDDIPWEVYASGYFYKDTCLRFSYWENGYVVIEFGDDPPRDPGCFYSVAGEDPAEPSRQKKYRISTESMTLFLNFIGKFATEWAAFDNSSVTFKVRDVKMELNYADNILPWENYVTEIFANELPVEFEYGDCNMVTVRFGKHDPYFLGYNFVSKK